MGTETAQVRVVDGRELPPVGRWTIDATHSDVQFVARHMMIAKVRGHFREFEGWIDVAERPEDSRVEVVIAASIDTGDPTRDAHLRSPDFLDVERYPHITYRSTAVRPAEGDRWRVEGDLTIRDVTRPVALDVEFEGVALDPWGNLRAGFVASAQIDREEFAVTWNQALETGGFLVGKGIRVELDIEAVLQGGP